MAAIPNPCRQSSASGGEVARPPEAADASAPPAPGRLDGSSWCWRTDGRLPSHAVAAVVVVALLAAACIVHRPPPLPEGCYCPDSDDWKATGTWNYPATDPSRRWRAVGDEPAADAVVVVVALRPTPPLDPAGNSNC